MEMTRKSATAAAIEIGQAIAEAGRHATAAEHLLPWVSAFTYWKFVVEALGRQDALAAAFDGFLAAELDDFGQDRGESWRMND